MNFTTNFTSACLGIFLLAALGCLAGDQAANQPSGELGFTSLFDGKSLDGWSIHGTKSGWSIKPGEILRNDASKGNHNWIYYDKKTFKDFILKLEWRVAPNGNSGIFLRAKKGDAPWATGVEVQISNAPRDASHCTGSLYGLAAVDPRPDESADVWHSYEIHCVGTRYTVIADGVTCVQSTDAHKALLARPLEGYIGLQDAHQKAPSYIEYRNIRIKELK
jgi:hypothetical protein